MFYSPPHTHFYMKDKELPKLSLWKCNCKIIGIITGYYYRIVLGHYVIVSQSSLCPILSSSNLNDDHTLEQHNVIKLKILQLQYIAM